MLFRSAAHVFGERLWQSRGGSHSIECRGNVAQYDPVDDMLSMWSSTQTPHSAMRLLAELLAHAPEQIEVSDRDGDGQQEVIIRHLYIERRLVPLNLYLQECFDAGLEQPLARANMERCVIEYGNAIKDLVAANIFPGDMLWKNFGVVRNNKVVFYDYDEIEYVTDCNFRRVPPPRCEEDEMSGEIWYSVGPKDVFPETFGPFLLGHRGVREAFMRHHADLLDAAFWQTHQARIRAGHVQIGRAHV